MRNTRKKGTNAESLAEKFLTEKGYKILEKNYYFERGEIDLIAEDSGIIVFVEVKSRSSEEYGEPEESITIGKRKQLRKVAEGYLYEKNITNIEARFDVVSIKWQKGKPIIEHLKNAF